MKYDPDDYRTYCYKCDNDPLMREIVTGYLAVGKDINRVQSCGYSILYFVIKYQSHLLQLLIDHGNVNVNGAVDFDGVTPLSLACMYSPSLVKVLLDNGANVNGPASDFKYMDMYTGTTMLHLACRYRPQIVHLLLRYGAKVNRPSKGGWTPLMLACSHHPSVVQLLMNHSAHVNAASNSGLISLMLACKYQPSVVKLLIDHGANVNAAEEGRWTPLHFVCKWSNKLLRQRRNIVQ